MPDLKVLTADPATGRLRPGLPRPPQSIEGIDLLVQNIVLLILNNGGRSIVAPDRAGGIRLLIGANYNPADPSELFADINLMVSQVEQRIKAEQETTRRPPSERLLALTLVDLIADEDQLEVDVVLQVVNEEQQTTQAVVVT